MKYILMLIVFFSFFSCQEKEVLFKDLQNRNGVYYEINSQKGFTGLAKDYYDNGQLKSEGSFKTGELI